NCWLRAMPCLATATSARTPGSCSKQRAPPLSRAPDCPSRGTRYRLYGFTERNAPTSSASTESGKPLLRQLQLDQVPANVGLRVGPNDKAPRLAALIDRHA